MKKHGWKNTLNSAIYADDIFAWADDSVGIVKMKKGQWVIENLNADFNLFGYCKDGKVIGNIHENIDKTNHKDLQK